LSLKDIKLINQFVDPFRSKRPRTADGGPVVYPPITPESINRRSGLCWFLEKQLGFPGYYADIELMVHKFEDEWYLVKYIDYPITFNSKTHWFVCDEIEGLARLLKNLFS
jgi:hypothetical protein